ncbi:MAG: hypothetical protein GX768_06460 [Chloroflexi bacterium]|jgi:hypothetical protein|nr:hypothetical protein [Chloroflexota bacterium]
MDTNDKLLQELGLLREAIERIADALEGIDDKLEDMIEVEEFDQSKLNQLLGLEEDEEFEEDDFDEDFDEDFDGEEQHD